MPPRSLPLLPWLLLALLPLACESNGAPEPAEVHPIGHATNACDLCDLYEEAQDWVVRIRTQTSIGSGVVFAESGLIVTNAHVVGANAEVLVETYDGRECPGTVVAADLAADLALVSTADDGKLWRPVPVEATESPRIGSEVYVIGHPLGLGWTITRGIVSGLRPRNGSEIIQTDAAISPGNSGGPLIDDHGHLLGIVTSKAQGGGAENIAFAQPLEAVMVFLDATTAAANTPAPSMQTAE